MVEMNPSYLQELCYTAQNDRLLLGNLVCGAGVANKFGGDLLVSSTGAADLSINVAQGGAFILGDEVADQGMYSVYNDDDVPLQFTANASGNPRIDTVVATVIDSSYGGGSDEWVLQILPGTPTVGATLTNLSGAEAVLPANTIRLAYVLISDGDTLSTILASGDILDARNNARPCSEAPWVEIQGAGLVEFAQSLYGQLPLTTLGHIDRDYFSISGSTITVLQDGYYDLEGATLWEADPDGYRIAGIFLNNTNAPDASPNGTRIASQMIPGETSAAVYQYCHRQNLEVTAGSTFKFLLFQNSGGGLDVGGSGAFHHFTIRRSG